MSLLNILTPRNILSVLHLILGVFVFVASIMTVKQSKGQQDDSDSWAYMTIALMLLSIFMIGAQLYGHKFFAQTGFIYTFGGRGVFYVFVACLLLSSYNANEFIMVVAIMAVLMGIISVAVAFFCTGGEVRSIDQPVPLFGPKEFMNIHARLDPSLTFTPLPLHHESSSSSSSSSSEVFSLEPK